LVIKKALVDLAVDTELKGETAVLHLRGEADLDSVPVLRDAMIGAVDQGAKNLVIDLSGLQFIDSTGLGTIVGGLRRVKERNGSFSIVATRNDFLKILKITGLDTIIPIFPTVEEALSA
jgi:anti-sigma B factor antagonist